MIKIKDLTVRNFMSVGAQTQAINFDKGQLTLVLGENLDLGGDDSGARNGTGKTTIINGLSYAIFGTALTNIKRDNLVNKINNKNMLVTVSFEEANFIKETFMPQYKLRELMLIPEKVEVDAQSTPIDINFESVDTIVMNQINAIDSDTYDKALLLEIYNNL